MKMASIGMIVVTALLSAGSTQAANVGSFTDLRTELVDRTGVLTGSTDKGEQKQGKACIKSVKAIDKSITLAGDIKAGSKVAKTLIKAFPNEFGANTPATVVFTNNLQQLLIAGYDNIGGLIQDLIDTLQTAIDALPSGSDKTNAQTGLDAAQAALDAAALAGDFSSASKLLATSLKAIAKSQQIVDKAGGGGGGSTNNTFVADIQISSTNDHYVATLFGEANYTVGTSTLDLGCSRGTFIDGSVITPALCGGFNGAPGDYALGGGCGGFFTYGANSVSYPTVTGTLHVATFSVTGSNATSSGTFTFSGSDGTNTINVINGQFNLSNILVFP